MQLLNILASFMTPRITGVHQNILEIKLCMDLSTEAVPVSGSFSRSYPPGEQDHRKLKILLQSDSSVV